MRRTRRSRTANYLVVATLLVPLLGSTAEAATAQYANSTVGRGSAGSDPGKAPVRTIKIPNPAAQSATPNAVSWPGAASADTALAAPIQASKTSTGSAKTAVGAAAHAAGTPVTLRAVADKHGAYQGPASVNVHVLDHAASAKADVNGLMFVTTPRSSGRGSVQVSVDYSSFAQAYGGNYASRLRLVELPACALTTPQLAACRTQTPLASTNDVAAHSITSQITLGQAASSSTAASSSGVRTASTASPMIVAATSSASPADGGAPAGQYGATSLKPAGSWSAGGSTGSFDYSYPISVPPAASSLVPTVGLSYDSGSIDGQTAATQAQADWLGDGWSTPENFIEQSFVPCTDSPEGAASPQSTNDECYDGNVLTISLNGTSTSLVRDDATGAWKLASDDGSVVALVTNAGNGAGTYNDAYWKVTERDGTSFYFGRNELPGWAPSKATTDSVQSEPVYSAHEPTSQNSYTDPCYNATWSDSWCTMAYRWNLDYVTDAHGNAMAYYYKQDSNAYAQNNNTAEATAYVRDSHIDHIDYGFTDGNAYGTVPDKVQFSTSDRCLAGASSCDPITSNTGNWLDTPTDLICAANAPCQVVGPSFYSTVRLTGITSEQYNGSGYSTVDSYTFTQTMPATGDDTAPTLFLDSISHTGGDTSAGGTAPPALVESFAGVQEQNRVDTATDGLPKLIRWRISGITTETGAAITVNYELTNPCTAPVTVSPASNTSSCYPVYWTPSGASAPLLDWFNKYVVKSVNTQDPTGGSPGLATSYKYAPNGGGPAWHYDDNEVVKAKYRTYGQYRGYADVQTFTGQGSDPLTESETTYYRGMSNDNDSTAVTLTDSQGGTHDDANQLAGDALETTQYTYSGGLVDNSSINSYWVSAASATRARTGLPALTANTVGHVETWTRQAITDTSPSTWRTTETDTSYDTAPADPNFGLPLITYAHGDLALSGNSQKRCTVTTYASANTAKNIVGLTAEVEEDALPCGGSNPNGASTPTSSETNALAAPASVNRPADVISDTRTFYDLQAPGSTTRPSTSPAWPEAAPTFGDVSETQQADGYTSGAFTYQPKSETTYDAYGRTLDAWDSLGNETQTSYTMTNGLTTGQTSTNPLGQVTSSVYDPERALATATTDPNGVVTQTHYDGLGRTIAIWLDSRPTTAAANTLYTYSTSSTAPSVTTTQTLNKVSGYATSETFYDSLLRPVQTQSPTPQGGRLLTETFYDTHGWTAKTDTNYWDTSSTPDTTMAPAIVDNDQALHQQTVTSYDGLGRAVEAQSKDPGTSPVVDQITYTQYTGDKTVTLPPTGAVAQATATDSLGRTTELDQYTTAPTVSTGTAGGFTTVSITGGATQATDYTFDNLGHQTDVKDVTTGEDWNSTYNMLGQVTAKSDPDAGSSNMTYDADGNQIQATDADGKAISYTYDALNRKTAEYDAPVSAQSASNELASWVYDNSNHVVTGMTDPIGHLTTETMYNAGSAYTTQQAGFNVFGDSTGETITIPTSAGAFSSTNSFTYGYAYDPTLGLPKSTTYPAAGGLPAETVGIGYTTSNGIDLASTLSSGSGSYVQNVNYTDLGQVWQAELGNASYNALITNIYDNHTGALKNSQIVNKAASATPIDQTSYSYDQAGNPTSQTETRQGTSSETQCFKYDNLDRLTQAWTATDSCTTAPTTTDDSMVGDAITGGAYWTSWTYDSLGQWKTQTQHSLTAGTADTSTSFTYGGSASACPATTSGTNTLASTSTTGPSGTTSDTFCYDKDGNTTQRNTAANGQQTMTWNDQGQLAAVTTASDGSSYVYDAEGNLLVEHDPDTSILYLPGQQLSLNTGNGIVTNTRFLALPDGSQVVRTGTGTNYSFELSDTHGTSLLDLNQSLTTPTWRQQTPYGAPRGTSATWPDNHGFLGKPQDPATGLTDVGARWYDPDLGRFESLDPVLASESPQQLNGYTYANDNPVTGSDPTGLCPADVCGVGTPKGSGGGSTIQTGPTDPGDPSAGYYRNGVKLPKSSKRVVVTLKITFNSGDQTSIPSIVIPYNATWGDQFVSDYYTDAMSGHYGDPFADPNNATPYTQFQTAVEACANIPACHGSPEFHQFIAMWLEFTSELVSISGGGRDSNASGVDAQALGRLGGSPAVEAYEGTPSLGGMASLGCNSFDGTTRVLMADGTTEPIDQVKVGDKIANNQPGADPGTKNQTHAVTAVHVTYTDTDFTNVTISTANGPATIIGTAHHPYWDATTSAWTDADHLRPGDRIETGQANFATILTTKDYSSHTIVTYNLTVDGLHTFYVVAGGTPVLVHNAPPAPSWLTPGNGVIYIRTDLNTGEEYVGQAKSWDRYIARQGEHARGNPNANYSFEVVDQAPPGTQLDLLEESWMRAGGGKSSIPGSVLTNGRVQMSDKRYTANGGSVSCP